MVSLSRQTESFSTSPLLLGGAIAVVGLFVFGGMLRASSRATISRVEELIDSLATEDLNPIVTEVDMDEIGLA